LLLIPFPYQCLLHSALQIKQKICWWICEADEDIHTFKKKRKTDNTSVFFLSTLGVINYSDTAAIDYIYFIFQEDEHISGSLL